MDRFSSNRSLITEFDNKEIPEIVLPQNYKINFFKIKKYI